MQITKKQIFVLSAFFSLSVAAVVHAEDKGKVHSSQTDSSGTTVTKDSSASDKVGLTGTRTESSDDQTTVDPKGLNNKTERKSHHEKKTDKQGNVSEVHNSLDGNGTKRELKTDKHAAHHLDGSTSVVSKESLEVDPKGLGNKKKMEVEKETRTSADGKVSTTTNTVNGEVVDSKTIVKP